MYCCAWCQHFRNTEKEGSDGYCFVDGTDVRLEDVCDEFEGKRGKKMTNEEWLNTLSVEKKAKFIARSCNLCSYDSDNGYCSDSLNVCKNGIKEWLKKKHIESMPELKVGDILRFRFKDGIMHTASVVGDDYMYSSDSGYGLAKISDSHYKILEVWRFNGKRLNSIWSDNNE